jgi:Na+-transporting methylmalonyl-CoA/oxaloacetate decarboxylase gamma subunit
MLVTSSAGRIERFTDPPRGDRVGAVPTSGMPMILIGMATVFCALGALAGMIALTTRVLNRSKSNPKKMTEKIPTASSLGVNSDIVCEPSEDILLHVALAAYSHHRMRGPGERTATAPTAWASAGRMRQVAPFHN